MPQPLKSQIKKIRTNWIISFWLLHFLTLHFDLFLEARAEILEKISLAFWSKEHFKINWPLILSIYLGYVSMALLQNYWITNIVSIEKFLQTLTLISSWNNLPSNFIVNPLWLFIRCFCITLPIRKRIKNDTEVPW